jgi:hypothetical protein
MVNPSVLAVLSLLVSFAETSSECWRSNLPREQRLAYWSG